MPGDSFANQPLRTSDYVPSQAYNLNETDDGKRLPATVDSHSQAALPQNSGISPNVSGQPAQQLNSLQNVDNDKEKLADRVAELEKKLAATEKDNRTLRSIIFRLSSPAQPLEDDGFYVMKLNSLDVTIERFVALSFKDKARHYLDDDDERDIVQLLGLYRPGRALLRFLDHQFHSSIGSIYINSFQRMVLVRHIIALCLCAHVFKPICFGIPDEVNQSMAKLLNYIIAVGIVPFILRVDK